MNKVVIIIASIITVIGCVLGGWHLRGAFIPDVNAPDTVIVTETIIDTVEIEKILPAEIIYVTDTLFVNVPADIGDSLAHGNTYIEKDGVGVNLDIWYHFKNKTFFARITNEIEQKTIYKTITVQTEANYPNWCLNVGAEWMTANNSSIYLAKFGFTWKEFLSVKSGFGVADINESLSPAVSIEANINIPIR